MPRGRGLSRKLLAWYDIGARKLPWRESKDFYRVWLSEVMLQQTRVEAVIPYFVRFLERFPSLEMLASAPANDVLALWSGLGYYRRARNLHAAAQRMAAEGLPENHQQILALPGSGPYTAAAIASIALGLPHAAVDGNVVRVISRLTNDASEVTSKPARDRFALYAASLLDPRRPGDFNQAMMELGATICVPRTPVCGFCPIADFCDARAAGTQRELPVKLKKHKAREIPLDLVLIQAGEAENGEHQRDSVFLVQRPASERRLAGFWELPPKYLFPRLRGKKRGEFRHQIVNDRYHVTVWEGRPAKLCAGNWFHRRDLAHIPLTTASKKALAAASIA